MKHFGLFYIHICIKYELKYMYSIFWIDIHILLRFYFLHALANIVWFYFPADSVKINTNFVFCVFCVNLHCSCDCSKIRLLLWRERTAAVSNSEKCLIWNISIKGPRDSDLHMSIKFVKIILEKNFRKKNARRKQINSKE